MIILAGTKPEHLNMLEGGIIAKLLDEKWVTFAKVSVLGFLLRNSVGSIHDSLYNQFFCLCQSVFIVFSTLLFSLKPLFPQTLLFFRCPFSRGWLRY